MEHTIDILKANKSDSSAIWQNEALQHRENWPWMKYSMLIAIKVRARMKELNLTQTTLAEKIGCTQQYVSLLLKGKENLTLETIAKLESTLEIQLFGSNSTCVDGYIPKVHPKQYLSDVKSAEYNIKD